MAVTIAVVIKNVCSSRKAEHVTYINFYQTLAIFALLVAQKLDLAHVCQTCPESDQHRNLISKICNNQTVCQNRPYE
jgi:hypothetical protein